MTSRERVRSAINHRQPDGVPVDFGSTVVTGIHAGAVSLLRKTFGLGGPEDRVKVFEPFQMLGVVEDDLREKLLGDCIGLFHRGAVFGFPNTGWKKWELFDGSK
ncbi:MAG: uroporphyrinogen decarboxylase family protein, partial [Candidatus Latescibacterota bacterium]